MADLVAAGLLFLSGFFFLSGTLGLLRFPDARTRLHAVTKADNLGLGFLVLALGVSSGSVAVGAKLVLIWLVALAASAGASYLIASTVGGTDEAEESR